MIFSRRRNRLTDAVFILQNTTGKNLKPILSDTYILYCCVIYDKTVESTGKRTPTNIATKFHFSKFFNF